MTRSYAHYLAPAAAFLRVGHLEVLIMQLPVPSVHMVLLLLALVLSALIEDIWYSMSSKLDMMAIMQMPMPTVDKPR